MSMDSRTKDQDLHHHHLPSQMVHRDDHEHDENDEMDRIIPVPILGRSQSQQSISLSVEDEDELKMNDKDDLKNPRISQAKQDPAVLGSTQPGNPYIYSSTSYPPPKPPHSKSPPTTHLTSHSHTPQRKPIQQRQRGTGPTSLILRTTDKIGQILFRHLKFVGPGLVSSVAYFDP